MENERVQKRIREYTKPARSCTASFYFNEALFDRLGKYAADQRIAKSKVVAIILDEFLTDEGW